MKSRFLLALFFPIVLRLAAQDVIVTGLSWADPHDPPDMLPTARIPTPDYPERLHGSTEIGYVMEMPFIDAKGKLLIIPRFGTDPLFEETLDPSKWRFKPARRDDKPVNSQVHFIVIFNPACASQGAPDATPRLLNPVLPELPRKLVKKDAPWPRLYVTARVDTEGHVTKAVAEAGSPDGLGQLAEEAVLKWTFAPGRKSGQPVEQDVRVPVVFLLQDNFDAAADTPPQLKYQKEPSYPRALLHSGLRGDVNIRFVIDIEGRVRNPVIVSSNNPGFDQPAIDAVLKWQFEPGSSHGVPVNIRASERITFQIQNEPGGGEDLFHVSDHVDQSKLPAEMRYDIPPKPANTVFAVYPFELLRDDVGGLAEVRFLVGPSGAITQATVIKAERPELGLALIAMLDEWHFQPAMKDGRPTWSVMDISQKFWRSAGSDVPVSDGTLDLLRELKREKPDFCSLKDLDARPQLLSPHPPVFPSALMGKVSAGQAVVEFLIDHDGNVQLPRIVSATDPAFGYAAVQGVVAWKFAPPTSHGRPVVVRAQIPVKFTAPKPESAALPPTQN